MDIEYMVAVMSGYHLKNSYIESSPRILQPPNWKHAPVPLWNWADFIYRVGVSPGPETLEMAAKKQAILFTRAHKHYERSHFEELFKAGALWYKEHQE